MLEGGDEGHVVNTSSGNGGIAPLTVDRDLRHHQGGGHDRHRGALRPAARRRQPHRRVGAVPGPEGAAHRAARVVEQAARRSGRTTRPARRRTRRSSPSRPACGPRASSPTTRRSRRSPRRRSAGIREDRFWILPASDRTDATIRARAESMLAPVATHLPGGPPMRSLPRHLGRHPRRAARSGVPRVARPRVPRAVRRLPRRAGSRRPSWPRPGLPQRGVRQGVARGERRGPARRLGRGRGATRSSTPTAWPARSSSPTPTRSPAAPPPPSAPASARRATCPASCCSPAPAPTTAGSPSCAPDSPERRAGVAVVPIMVDVDAAVAEIRRAHECRAARRHPHPADVAAVRAVPPPAVRPGVGGVRGALDAGARALGRRPTGPPTARTSASSRPRPASGRRGRSGSSSGPGCSSGSPTCGSAWPSAVRSG